MIEVLRICGCVLFLVAIVHSTVHHTYINDRFNDFSENDYRIVFPDELEQQKSTLVLVNVVSINVEDMKLFGVSFLNFSFYLRNKL